MKIFVTLTATALVLLAVSACTPTPAAESKPADEMKGCPCMMKDGKSMKDMPKQCQEMMKNQSNMTKKPVAQKPAVDHSAHHAN